MATREIESRDIGLPLEGEVVFDGSFDPLELATQALAKLKTAGLLGYIDAPRPEASNLFQLFPSVPEKPQQGPEHQRFEATYLQESKKVRSLAARIVGPDKAEDVVSETFFRAWNNRHKFVDTGVGMAPWLLRITYNLCMDIKRGESRFVDEDPELIFGYLEDTHDDYEQFEGREAAEELLATVTPEQRDAMRAVYVEGDSFAGYAQRNGKTYGGTKSLVHRGKVNILKNMDSSTKIDVADVLSASERAQLTPRQQEIFALFLPRVGAIARKIAKGSDEPIEDFAADGYLGLFKAVQRYDPDKVSDEASNGTGYIYSTIVGSILRGMRQWYGRDLSNKDKISRVKPSVLGGTSASIEAPLSPDDEESWTLGDTLSVSDEEAVDYELLKERVFSEASVYSDRDKEILVRRIILDQTQSQIAAEVGISQMHVSRLLERMSVDLGSKISY